MISIDTLTLSLLAGAVLPLATALLTKCSASPGVKSLTNLALSLATAAVAILTQAGGHIAWQSFVVALYAAYAASGTAHNHLWKPTGVIDAVAAVAPSVGLGTPVLHRERPL